MSLTGNALPTVLALIALVLFFMLVTGHPRVRKPWQGALSRAVCTVVLNLSVLALAGALLNDQYAFYVSWSDLFGAQAQTVAAHGGTTGAKAARAKVKGVGLTKVVTPDSLPALPSRGARLQKYEVTGATSHVHNEVLVYLPKGYNPAATHKYPVILALHGFPSHPEVFGKLHFFTDLDKAVDAKKLAASIVVMPEINYPSASLDTECVNVPGGPQIETWLDHDLPVWTVQHFRVSTARTSWATWGFSFGGWCAAMLSVRHPDVFGAAVIIQGYFRPDFDVSYEPLQPGTPAYEQYDLVRIALKHPPAISMWILASKQDSLSYPSTNQLIKDARAPLSITADLLKNGGHRVSIWLPKVPETFAWLGKTLPGFKP